MEKGKPQYLLSRVKACVTDGKIRSTGSALAGAAHMGLSFADMLVVVANLDVQNFYKSMTTHGNHQVWQDVYHVQTSAGEVYLKLTIENGLLIVSFKEL